METHNTCSYRCEQTCTAWANGNCNETLCLASDIWWCAFFGMAAILQSIRLYQFFKNQPKPKFTLKKMIFIFGIIGAGIRSIRFGLMAANVPAPLVVYQLLWMWSGNCFFMMFTLLLMFWANLIRKGRIPFQWLGKRMKFYFIGLNIFLFFLFSIFAGFQQVSYTLSSVVINAGGILLTGGLAIAALYEGYSLIRTLRASKGEGVRDYALVRKITLLSIGTACIHFCLLLHTSVVFIVGRLYKFPYENCHAHQFVFTSLFSVGMAVLLIPMADFRVERRPDTPEKKSTPKKSTSKPGSKSNSPNPSRHTEQTQFTQSMTMTQTETVVHPDLTASAADTTLIETDEKEETNENETSEETKSSEDPDSQVHHSLMEYATEHERDISISELEQGKEHIKLENLSPTPEK